MTDFSFDTATVSELRDFLKIRNIELPPGWSKMSPDRKRRWSVTEYHRKSMPNAVKKATARVGLIGTVAGVAVKALTKFGSMIGADNELDRQVFNFNTGATMPKDMQWRRRPAISVKAIQYMVARRPAPDPEPMTRQVRRLNQRRSDKVLLSNLKTKAAKGRDKLGGSAAVNMTHVRKFRAEAGYNASA